MAAGEFELRVVCVPLQPTELVDRLTDLITQHVAQCSEGVVPAVLAEELVSRLQAQDALLFLDELEGA